MTMQTLDMPKKVLSYSQIRKFSVQPYAYELEYVHGVKTPKTSALLFGSAVDTSANIMNARKIQTGEIIPEDEAIAVFNDAWADGAETTEFDEEESPEELLDKGRECVKLYREHILTKVNPIKVQTKFFMDLLVDEDIIVTFMGIIDRIDQNEKDELAVDVIDLKTAKRKVTEWFDGMDRIQFTGNVVGAERDLGLDVAQFVGNYLIHGVKKPYLRDPAETTQVINEDMKAEWEQYIIHQARQISECYTKGFFPASCYRSGWWCSKKWCAHYGKTCKFTGGKGPQ